MTYSYDHDANKPQARASGPKLRKRDVNDAHMRTLRGEFGVPHMRPRQSNWPIAFHISKLNACSRSRSLCSSWFDPRV
ncbi:hypothetical protein HZ326_3553 [Fusarium oxysporum f. sp. albedinis]|nr:hypothetical protein HZ326_3553 [Fusarium oxysporum f. sp. albedinis]